MEIIITIATVVIALCTIASYRLGSKIQIRDKEYRQQTSDLFQAIVIATILSDPEVEVTSLKMDRRIEAFKKYYKGEIQIFE